MPVTLTVVVVASGRAAPAARLEPLEPLAVECAQQGVELLLADARSHDERRTQLEHGGARLVEPAVAGDATARDAALRAASGDWVVLLDDDVVVSRRWLRELRRDVWSAAPGVGAVTGGAVVPGTDDADGQDRAPASSLPTDVAYRRLALLCAGGFEQRFPRAGSRHVELLERLRRRGWKVVAGDRAPVHALLRPRVWGRGVPDVPAWRRRLSDLATRRDVRAVLFDGLATLVDVSGIDEDRARPVPGAREVVAGLRRRGLLLGVVSDEQVDNVRAAGLVDAALGPFDVWAVCPHAPEELCRCRTSDSGLVLESTARLGVAPGDVLVVGGHARHVESARAAGAQGAVVDGGPSALRHTLGPLAGTGSAAG